MEVYEVMFFAVPLWFVMVGFIFSLVFGRDILRYFESKRLPEVTAESRQIELVVEPEEESAPEYPSPSYEVASSRDRELVLH